MATRLTDGLRLAVTTLTVAPVRPGRVDRDTAAVAMTAAPLVGAAVGLAQGAVLRAIGAPALLAAAVAVATGVALTRALHLDGLADTADALGSYTGRERALDIMKRPDIGPFGVVAIVLVLLGQVAALSAGPTLVAVVVAAATGRLAITWACRRGVPAARPDGLGALVAGTVGPAGLTTTTAAVVALAVAAVPGRPWQGPVAVAAALAAAVLLVRHTVRRFGGITGDVLGAVCEVSTTMTLAVLVAV